MPLFKPGAGGSGPEHSGRPPVGRSPGHPGNRPSSGARRTGRGPTRPAASQGPDSRGPGHPANRPPSRSARTGRGPTRPAASQTPDSSRRGHPASKPPSRSRRPGRGPTRPRPTGAAYHDEEGPDSHSAPTPARRESPGDRRRQGRGPTRPARTSGPRPTETAYHDEEGPDSYSAPTPARRGGPGDRRRPGRGPTLPAGAAGPRPTDAAYHGEEGPDSYSAPTPARREPGRGPTRPSTDDAYWARTGARAKELIDQTSVTVPGTDFRISPIQVTPGVGTVFEIAMAMEDEDITWREGFGVGLSAGLDLLPGAGVVFKAPVKAGAKAVLGGAKSGANVVTQPVSTVLGRRVATAAEHIDEMDLVSKHAAQLQRPVSLAEAQGLEKLGKLTVARDQADDYLEAGLLHTPDETVLKGMEWLDEAIETTTKEVQDATAASRAGTVPTFNAEAATGQADTARAVVKSTSRVQAPVRMVENVALQAGAGAGLTAALGGDWKHGALYDGLGGAGGSAVRRVAAAKDLPMSKNAVGSHAYEFVGGFGSDVAVRHGLAALGEEKGPYWGAKDMWIDMGTNLLPAGLEAGVGGVRQVIDPAISAKGASPHHRGHPADQRKGPQGQQRP